MESLLQDIRYACRILRRNPGFTLVAVMALALGIGANSAIFSVVDAVVLKPLPYPVPQQLVQVWGRFTGIGIPDDRNAISAPEFVDLQRNDSFSSIAAIDDRSFNINFGATPERVLATVVTPAFFPLLGVQAQVGRVFRPEEGQLGNDHVVLLTDGLWRSRFRADPSISGRKLIMNGESYLITGVLPRDFKFSQDVQVYTPLAFSKEDLSPDNRGSHGLNVIARIKSGLTLEQARLDMAAVSARIIRENPGYPYRIYHFTVLIVPLLEQRVGDIKTALWVLMGAVGLVLLIACANVANLLLVRASAREREMAIRQALGVSRGRLVVQLLTESVLLAFAGAAAGLLLAWCALRLLISAASTAFPRVAGTTIDLSVLLFTVVVTLGTGILFGLAPVFHSARQSTDQALKEGTRGSSSGSSNTLRGALVIAELALSLMLLAGAGLLVRSFLSLEDVNGGFRPNGVLTMRLSLPPERYTKPQQVHAFYRDLLDGVRRLPGVDAAGAVTGLPLTGTGWSGTALIDTQAVAPQDTTPEVDQRPITPGYFEAMGTPLLRGRYFDQRDTETSAPVAIVDETLANTYWPGQDAIGQHIKIGGHDSTNPWFTVVGIVRHIRYRTLESPSRVELYWPLMQTPFALSSMSLAIHTGADAHLLTRAVQSLVSKLDPNQPVYSVRTMREIMSESLARRRLSMFLLGIFAAIALALAAVGIYGVVSYSVAQRAREMGIRLALGAHTADIVRLILGQSLWLVTVGVLVGVGGSMLLTRYLSSLLFRVPATDPLTYVVAGAVLGGVALIASFIPTWRASTTDPVQALRQE